jgi:hypothetical protein
MTFPLPNIGIDVVGVMSSSRFMVNTGMISHWLRVYIDIREEIQSLCQQSGECKAKMQIPQHDISNNITDREFEPTFSILK